MGDDKNSNIGIIGLIILGMTGLFFAYLAWNASRRHTTTVTETAKGYVIVEG